MNSPRRPDGPPVKDGKPYSAIAHLAEDVTPFIAMAKGLRARGFSAPEIYAADIAEGFIALEDLGAKTVVAGDPPAPIRPCYEAAVHVLIALHKQILPDLLPVAPHVNYRLPAYDLDAFMIEVELLLDWYLPFRRATLSPNARSNIPRCGAMRCARRPTRSRPGCCAIFIRPTCCGCRTAAASPASACSIFRTPCLARRPTTSPRCCRTRGSTCRRHGKPKCCAAMCARAASTIRNSTPEILQRLYATMAAQRASKILGIFARLNRRDRKPQYLRHLPRVWNYLQRALAHPALAPLADWYKAHVPAPEASSK